MLPAATLSQAWTSFRTQLFSFKGRSTRAEYWWIALLAACTYIATQVFTAVLGAVPAVWEGAEAVGLVGVVVAVLVQVGVWVCTLALRVRRFHDTGRSATGFIVSEAAAFLSGTLSVVAAGIVLVAAIGSTSQPEQATGPIIFGLGVFAVAALLGVGAVVYQLVVYLTGSKPDNQYGPRRAGPAPLPAHTYTPNPGPVGHVVHTPPTSGGETAPAGEAPSTGGAS